MLLVNVPQEELTGDCMCIRRLNELVPFEEFSSSLTVDRGEKTNML